MRKPSLGMLLTVLVPLVLITAWWARFSAVVSKRDLVAFSVSGFDPLDPLSGHYLTFRVMYSPEDPCADLSAPAEQCVCFAETSEIFWHGECQHRPESCSRFLAGECSGGRFTAGIERYYIPERLATTEPIPPDSTIIVALDGMGGGVVTEFLVGKEPVVSWLERLVQQTPVK